MKQDSKGYVWVATAEGVCRFDGNRFEKFTTDNGLTANMIFQIYEDRKGRIWFLSYSAGISYFQDGKIRNIAANDSLKKLLGYRNEVIVSFYVDKGDTLWMSYNNLPAYVRIPPAGHFKKIEFINVDGGERALSFLDAAMQPLYTTSFNYTKGGTLRLIYPQSTYTVPMGESYNSGVPTYVKMFRSDKGDLFFSVSNYLYHISGNRMKGMRRLPNRIISLAGDKKGNLWAGVYQNGVYKFPGGEVQFEAEQYLHDLSVTHTMEDREHGLWFSTLESGVFYASSPSVQHLDLGTDNAAITALIASSGKLVAGSAKGKVSLLSYDEKKKVYVYAGSFTAAQSYYVSGIDTLDNDLLVYSSGMERYDLAGNKKDDFRRLKFPFGACDMERDTGGDFIFATRYQVFYSNGRRITDSSLILPNRIKCIKAFPNGDLYIGCLDGLWLSRSGRLTHLGAKDKTFTFPVTALLKDEKDRLWVASKGGGVAMFEGDRFHVLNQSTAGIHNICTALDSDKKGRIWVGSNNGLFLLSGNGRLLKRYSIANGLRSNEIRAVACFGDHLFAGSSVGIDHFSIETDLSNTVPPLTLITQLRVNEEVITGTEMGHLPHDRNQLSFSFLGITFKDPKREYRYRLSGFEKEWKKTFAEEITYTNLPPGDYTFIVSSVNADGVSSSKPASVSFTINKPWWRLTWVMVAFVALAALLLFAIVYFYVTSMRRRQQRKAEIEQSLIESRLLALRAQMNPHFIFNVINSIQHFILYNDRQKAYDYLTRFSRLIRMVLDNSRFTSITLDKEVQLLNVYADLEKLRFEGGFDFSVRVTTQSPPETISLPNMLIQPFVENAIVHGIATGTERGSIEVEFFQRGERLSVTVTDNGIGRQAAMNLRKNSRHKSSGMMITAERLQILGELSNMKVTINVEDLVDDKGLPAGTRVELQIPLNL